MKQYVVYRILNIRNKRVYIGSTNDFETRKQEHLGQLRKKKHINRFLQSDFNDFKEDSFVFEIVFDYFKTRESMLIKEYELILKTKGKNYNIHTACPAVNGSGKGLKKSLSLRRQGKFLVGTNKKAKSKLKKVKAPQNFSYPKLDALIEKKRLREERQLNAQNIRSAISSLK